MKLFYSRSSATKTEDRRYQNPRHFMGVVEGATDVLIDGDYPEIERAYDAAGATVARVDGGEVQKAAPAKQKAKRTAPKADAKAE